MSRAQLGEGGGDEILFCTAWVDPANGTDTGNLASQVNDPDQPFQKLQSAIDACWNFIQDNPAVARGIVYALPGTYGPRNQGCNGGAASDDSFPILMRDRVSVQGMGARRCILRGVDSPNKDVFWPNAPTAGSSRYSEVLLDFTFSHPCDGNAPWCGQPDATDVLDAFTLEGGDVQILFGDPDVVESHAIISNCVFDMRHDWSPPECSGTVAGPYFGILMVKTFAQFGSDLPGYPDDRVLIANNTFVMAHYLGEGPGWLTSRDEAVGVMDVTRPGCTFPQITARDCDDRLRGEGNPILLNNLFRTAPIVGTPANVPMAMLGIDITDTRVFDPMGMLVQTNAFAKNRAGSQNLGTSPAFYSLTTVSGIVRAAIPVNDEPALWNCNGTSSATSNNACGITTGCPTPICQSAAPPASAVPLWDGLTGELDVGFVGEYLETAQGLTGYTDWRLLPSNDCPLKDLGFAPTGSSLTSESMITFNLPGAPMPELFDWDGEEYGNPRSWTARQTSASTRSTSS